MPAVTAGGRLDWVDAAKGMTILLVVVHHAVLFLQQLGLVPPAVATANMALASLRMPLFFLVSGLFLAGPLTASWRTMLHKRVALFGYLYVLWTAIQYAVMVLLPADLMFSERLAGDPVDQLRTLLVPAPSMWFLYALALYSVLAKLVRRVPMAAQLGVTGVLSAVVGAGLLEPDDTWGLAARYLFFFLLGFHARTVVERLAAASTPVRAALAVPATGALAAVAVVLDVRGVPGVALLLNVAAVVCGVLVAAQLARWAVGRPLVLLGRHTLPVYLANMPWLGVIALVLRDVPVPPALGYVLPVLLAVVTTGLTLLTWRVLLTLRAGWMYTLPGPLAHRRPAGSPRRALPPPAPVRAPAPGCPSGVPGAGVVAGPMGVRR
nr:acyltransferase family protein [Pseudonocardia sp. C8]